jgi:ribonuclease Z
MKKMFRVTLLGTAAAAPTRDRGLPAVAVEREGRLLLFDCGEGTQRQMVMAKPSISNPDCVFITHLHGDHLLGLLGLIQSLALQNREEPLRVFGPRGLDQIIEFNLSALHVYVPYKIAFRRVTPGVVLKEKEFKVRAHRTLHAGDSYAYRLDESTRPGRFYPDKALGLGVPQGPLWKRLQDGRSVKSDGKVVRPGQVSGSRRKGRSFGYSGDARPTEDLARFFRGVDILVFDGTYSEEFADKAKEYLHSTVGEAAQLASDAEVGRLVITHVSSRINDSSLLLRQASKRFKNVAIGEDFSSYDLALPE